jgi:hypothetical protein
VKPDVESTNTQAPSTSESPSREHQPTHAFGVATCLGDGVLEHWSSGCRLDILQCATITVRITE